MVTLVTIADSNVTAAVALDDWLKDTLTAFPGIVRSVAARELLMAAREFYQRSFAWQHTIEEQNLVAGRVRYRLLITNTYADVVGVLGVALNGVWMPAAAGRPIPPSPDNDDTADQPSLWYIGDPPDGVELFPDPSVADIGALSFRVALTVRESSTTLPRLASQVHYEPIMDGFLARVYAHPRKPYSSPNDSAMRRRKFNAAVAEWRGQVKQGYAQAQNWRFPSGWGVFRRV